MAYYCDPNENYENYCNNDANANCTGSCGNPIIYTCGCYCDSSSYYPYCDDKLNIKFIGYILSGVVLFLLCSCLVKSIKQNRFNNLIRSRGHFQTNHSNNRPFVFQNQESVPPPYESLSPSYQEYNIPDNK